jgi:hypothetical protein
MEQGSKPVERRRPSLSTYITYLLGSGSSNQLKNWFERSWGARSFADFWRCFNPVYGYYLSYHAYRPLRRVVPRALAMWLTFIASGFLLHDLVGWALGRRIRFPEMTPCLRAARPGRARERRIPYGHVAVAVRRSRWRKHRVHRRLLPDRHSTAPAVVERRPDVTPKRVRGSGSFAFEPCNRCRIAADA